MQDRAEYSRKKAAHSASASADTVLPRSPNAFLQRSPRQALPCRLQESFFFRKHASRRSPSIRFGQDGSFPKLADLDEIGLFPLQSLRGGLARAGIERAARVREQHASAPAVQHGVLQRRERGRAGAAARGGAARAQDLDVFFALAGKAFKARNGRFRAAYGNDDGDPYACIHETPSFM